MSPEQRRARLEREIKESDVHKALRDDPNFKNAIKAFRVRSKARSSSPAYREPLAEARFAHLVVDLLNSHALNPEQTKREPLRREAKRAHGHLEKLIELIDSAGIRYGDHHDHAAMRGTLIGLRNHLEATYLTADARRRSRDDKDAPRRFFVTWLSRNLMSTFGEAPPSVVMPIAAMLGFEVDETTVARYAAERG